MTNTLATVDCDAVVRTANVLLSLPWNLTDRQTRLLYIVASQVKISDTDFQEYIFESGEILRSLGVEGREKKDYQELQALSKSMLKDVMEIPLPDGSILQTAWFSTALYKKGGTVIFRLSPELKPYYVDLVSKGGFTRQILGVVLSLRGAYSIHLHGLLIAKNFTANKAGIWKLELSLSDIRKIMALENKYLGKTGPKNIRVRVIKPAVDEINEKSDLEVRYDIIRNRRGIAGFVFNVRYKNYDEKNALSQEEVDYEGLKKILKGKKLKDFEAEWENIQKQEFISDGIISPHFIRMEAESKLLKKYMEQ